MRRMNYPRFDKPTYTGTFDSAQSQFVMNDIPKPGFYFVVINDIDSMQYSCTFTIKMGITTVGSWHVKLDEYAELTYIPDDGNLITATSTGILPETLTIELYKLN